MTTRPKFRNRREAAEYIRDKWGIPCTSDYLAKRACDGDGPEYHRLHGLFSAYTEEALDKWAQSRISPPMRKARALDAHAA